MKLSNPYETENKRDPSHFVTCFLLSEVNPNSSELCRGHAICSPSDPSNDENSSRYQMFNANVQGK